MRRRGLATMLVEEDGEAAPAGRIGLRGALLRAVSDATASS